MPESPIQKVAGRRSQVAKNLASNFPIVKSKCGLELHLHYFDLLNSQASCYDQHFRTPPHKSHAIFSPNPQQL